MKAKVLSKGLNLREEPNEFAKVINVLKLNDEVQVLKQDLGKWTKVSYGIYTGYVATRFIELVEGGEMHIVSPLSLVNRDKFIDKIQVTLFNRLSQRQLDSINAIIDEIEAQGVDNKLHQAYIFATAYHEAMDIKTGERIVPVSEYGGSNYLSSKVYYPYYGRGFVQLTWDYNYKKYQRIIERLDRFKEIDIVNHPESAKEVKLSAFIAVHGMVNGSFTGKKLSDYTTFMPMRKIINGTDKANLIASYANSFLTALQ